MRSGGGFRRGRTILSLVVASLALGGSPALAVPTPRTADALPHSQFQGGDGDQDDALPLIDWEGLQADGRVRHTSDANDPDRIFSQGSHEYAPDDWVLTTTPGGASPPSQNIRDFYSAVDRGDNGDAFVYLAFTRQAASGSAYVAFDLNQDARLWTNAHGSEIPCRKTGDVLINFVWQGGASANIQIRRWQTTGDPGPHGCARTGLEHPATDLTAEVVQGAVNSGAIANHLPGHFSGEIPDRQFGEVAINLTQALHAVHEECGTFASTWMHSRASIPVTSDLKDFVHPHPLQLATCKERPHLRTRASGSARRRPGGGQTRRHSAIGSEIWDTAILSGGLHPTGTLRFRLYGPDQPDCAGRPIFRYSATVDGNGAYRSGSYLPTQRGTYRWVVRYSGDVNNEPAGRTACGDPTETVVVGRARPRLTTTARPTGLVHVGGPTIYDTAHLRRGFEPRGRITFRLFGPNNRTCRGRAIFTSRRRVNGNGDYNSAGFRPTRAGTYRWVVSYSGDADNRRAGPTACGIASETIVVRRAEPGIVTVASPETTAGSPVTDSALLSGGARPRGRITFRLYGPDDEHCSGDPIHTSTRRVRGNGEYTSGPFTPGQAGTYRWIAIYSGDRNNARAATSCNDAGESVIVGPPPPVQPDLSTTALPAAARAGSLIRDTAHLSGGDDPGGSISFELFGPNDDDCSTPIFFSSRTVSGNGDYTSRAFRVRDVGTYRWVAVYSGDEGRNKPAGPTACDDPAETVTVAQAQPRIRTVAQRSALVGLTVRDGAFLSGASRPTGTITFRLYGPNDATCSGAPAYRVRQVVVDRNGFYPSPRFRVRSAGTYRWTATYGGDGNNVQVGTNCGDRHETTTVLRRRPRLRTSASPPAYLHHGRRARAAGQEIYDSARLTRTFRGRGSITFDLYGPNDRTCSGPVIFRWVTAVRGNNVYNSGRFTPTTSGVYRWRATYSGDADNRPAGPTRCRDRAERVRVTVPAHPTLTTSASQAVTLGGSIHDVAHLSGASNPRGTITFKLYRNESCSGRPVFRSTLTVAGNGDYASASFVPTTAGAYRWVAKYSGDRRNHPAGPTACDDPAERAIVRPPGITPVVPSFSTRAAQYPAGGATVYDTATLAGGSDPSGAITFELFGPDDTACSGPPVFVTTVAVMGNGDYPSAKFAVPAPGTYRWVVTYSGDALNAGIGPTACGDPTETVSVGAAPAPEPNPGPNVRPPKGEVKPEAEARPKPPPPPPPIVTG